MWCGQGQWAGMWTKPSLAHVPPVRDSWPLWALTPANTSQQELTEANMSKHKLTMWTVKEAETQNCCSTDKWQYVVCTRAGVSKKFASVSYLLHKKNKTKQSKDLIRLWAYSNNYDTGQFVSKTKTFTKTERGPTCLYLPKSLQFDKQRKKHVWMWPDWYKLFHKYSKQNQDE